MREREVRRLVRRALHGRQLTERERTHVWLWPPVWNLRLHGERFACVSNEVARMFYALCLEATR